MLEDIIKDKFKKLEIYRKKANPYPAKVKRTAEIGDVVGSFSRFEKSQKLIYIVGRIMSLRDQGKIIFVDIRDESGSIQAVLKNDETKRFDFLKETLDLGDFIQVGGEAFKTKTGAKSVLAKDVCIIVKSLRPLPDKWHGLEDIEKRLRERYLDLLFRPEVKEMFIKKSRFWDEIRSFVKKAGFLEVEMPILESVPGGAEAEPFVTHMNALDRDFYLRISLEIPLKKLLVGGYEKVFEIGRIFRNEGISKEHLQDYTQMECYWAYADYEDMMKFTESLYKEVIKKTIGTLKTKSYGFEIDWGKKWRKVDYYEIFKKEAGLDLDKATEDDLFKKARALGLKPETGVGKGRLIDTIFKHTARKKLIQPSFLINPPADIEPLAKRLSDNPEKVARFQITAAGTELGKGFSELNDPIDQRKRFEEQMKLRQKGDTTAQQLDEEYLRAMEYGMPPAGGFGMSERLFAVLVDKPIRETVIFPLMKIKK